MHLNPQYLTAAGAVTAAILGGGFAVHHLQKLWAWRMLARRYQKDDNQCPSDQS